VLDLERDGFQVMNAYNRECTRMTANESEEPQFTPIWEEIRGKFRGGERGSEELRAVRGHKGCGGGGVKNRGERDGHNRGGGGG